MEENTGCRGILLANFAVSASNADSDEFMVETLDTSSLRIRLVEPVSVKLRKPEASRQYNLKELFIVSGKPVEYITRTENNCEDYSLKGAQICPTFPEKYLTKDQARLNKLTKKMTNLEGFCCPCKERNNFLSGTLMGRKRCCTKNFNPFFEVVSDPTSIIDPKNAAGLGAGVAVASHLSAAKSAVMVAAVDVVGRFLNKSNSVHCISYPEDKWYVVFQIEPPIIDYAIEIEVDQDKFTLSPESKHVDIKTPRLIGKATLIGDYANTQPVHSVNYQTHKIVARIGTNASFDDLQMKDIDWKNSYMIPNAYFDLSGFSCNKIGVSSAAFRSQTRRCEGMPDECLDDQIEDLIERKIAQPVLGQDGFQGWFCTDAKINGKKIKCRFLETQTTRVNLHLHAHDLMVLVGDPPVELEKWKLENRKGEDRCHSDEPCWLVMYLRNMDDTVAGLYNVSVAKCQKDTVLLSHGAQTVGIPANKSARVDLEFIMTKEEDEEDSNECTIAVTSESEGDLIREFKVIINTGPAPRKGRDDEIEQTEQFKQETVTEKTDSCENCGFASVACLIQSACMRRTIEDLIKIGCGVGALVLLINFGGPLLGLLNTSIKFSVSALRPLLTRENKKTA